MPIQHVVKRDGSIVGFDQFKITTAIFKALKATNCIDQELAQNLSNEVLSHLEADNTGAPPTVEQIQDVVEHVLIDNRLHATAKAYIRYREQHTELRNLAALLNSTDIVDHYLNKNDWRVTENSNMSYSLQGLNNYLSSTVIANYWLNKIYSDVIAKAHESGDIHIHDLGILSAYCVGWDLRDLLTNGFGHVAGKITSAPAKHFRTMLGQIVNFFYTLQGECYSEDTQVLTKKGWKYFFELTHKDLLFTLNIKTKRIELQKPLRFFEFKNKNMIHFENEDIDLLVTENHNMLVGKRNPNSKPGSYELVLVSAKEYDPDIHLIPTQVWFTETNTVSSQLSMDNTIFQKTSQSQLLLFDSRTPSGIPENAAYFEDCTNPKVWNNETISSIKYFRVSEESITKDARYTGSVYCVEVPNHTLYVRRNGKAVWCGNSAGAQALSNFDTFLAPFIRRDALDLRQVKQSIQEFLFNMNVPTRSGAQTPFTNVTLDLTPSILLKDEPVILGGQLGSTSYGDYQTEMDLFNEAFAEVMLEGDANNRVFTFPIPTYNITKDFDWENPVYQRIFELTGKFGVPYFCLHESTEIITQKGIKSLGDVTTDDKVVGKDGKFYPITSKVTSIQEKTVKITLEDNEIIIASKNHRFPIQNQGLKDAGSIRLDDQLIRQGSRDSHPVKIKSITEITSPQTLVDIEVASPDHLFRLKTGILTHNSNFVNSDMKPEDARSMCPLAGDEKVLVQIGEDEPENIEIGSVYALASKQRSKTFSVYSDGKFVEGHFNKFPNQAMVRVVLENGHSVKMSMRHINMVIRTKNSKIEELEASELKKGMYLPYSLARYSGSGGSRDLGHLVGAFAGGGTFEDGSTIVFSLKKKQTDTPLTKLKRIAENCFCADCEIVTDDKALPTLKIRSKAAICLVKEFVSGSKDQRCFNGCVFTQSIQFREGVLAGQHAFAGEGSRIHTTSKKMVQSLNLLAATLGTTTDVYFDWETQKSTDKPTYSVLIYRVSKDALKDVWFKKHGKLWMKIKSIEKSERATAYCFEVTNDEPIFTIGTTGILTHNCRLRLDNRELIKRGGGLFGSNPQTGSIGVVTLNMPRIGYLAKDDVDFYERIDHLVQLASESLEIKRKIVEKFTVQGLYPYSRFFLRDVYARDGTYWSNHFSTIGIVGMNEALLNYIGVSIVHPEGRKFALKVMDHIRDLLSTLQKDTGNNYNFEATPAEGTSYRLARIDSKLYPDIIVANHYAHKNHKAAPFYTNSTQLPVDYDGDLFEALELQDELQTKYTGGTVFHIFLGERPTDWIVVRDLIRTIAEKFRLPYYTLTPTFSVCPVHGYLAGEHEFCPKCDEERGYVSDAAPKGVGLN